MRDDYLKVEKMIADMTKSMASQNRLPGNFVNPNKTKPMESIHVRFLAAIAARRLIRLGYYRPSDNQLVEERCAAFDYGPNLESSSNFSRYWILVCTNESPGEFCEFLGLQAKRIVTLQLINHCIHDLDSIFSYRRKSIARDWEQNVSLPVPLASQRRRLA